MIVFLVFFLVVLVSVSGIRMYDDYCNQVEIDRRIAKKYGWDR